jgi:hypothetical protein
MWPDLRFCFAYIIVVHGGFRVLRGHGADTLARGAAEVASGSMTGILNDFNSSTLALITAHYVGDPLHLSTEQIDSGTPIPGEPDIATAQVYATLALVQAVRELTNEVAKRP